MSWSSAQAGHENLVEAFRRVAARGRLAHAYLFVGPEGVGKRRFAIELAKSLSCARSKPGEIGDPCDQCPDCVQIEAGTHPDFQLVGLPEDKLEFPLEQMQEIVKHIGVKPARGRHRIVIIDDADTLNDESANAFLKTLEEPPPHSLLILLSVNRNRQLPTVVSRCQVIRFPPLPEELVARKLVEEEIATSDEEARRWAARGGGSVTAAKALADPELWKARRAVLDRLSQPRIDSVAIAVDLAKFVDEAGKEGAPKRQRASQMLGFVVEFLRNAIRLQHGQTPRFADPADETACRRLAGTVSTERLLQAVEKCVEAGYLVDRRIQLVLVLEAAIDALGQRLQAG